MGAPWQQSDTDVHGGDAAGTGPHYSFALIGLTIGMFSTRKLFRVWSGEINEGVRRDRYDYPRSHLVFCVVSMIVMSFAAFVLTG
ncbi:hypothetical protein [Streptomyces sp. KR55]|uniref:hypothetical protein n=1 Tax=Streptomyces sp. KR55 TaxID=3457425 RepID=UPI003FD1FBBA